MGRHHKHWLQAYLNFTRHSESPEVFHFWTGVSTIGGALRRRVWIDQRHFKWTPNFYIILVAPPGIAAKSTSAGIGMNLLNQVPGIHFGPNSMTWQALTVALEEARDAVLLDNDSRVLQMSCLTIESSELGTFLKPKDGEMIDFLVEMWDGKEGKPWKHKTKTGNADGKTETTIINPWINFIGCTTPAWMRGNFPTYMAEGGLISRIVFIHANAKRQYIAYPSRHIDAAQYAREASLLIEDLQHIATIVGEYEITPEGYLWGEAWYERHWKSRPIEMTSDKFVGYLSRKQTHIHKLAMVLAASQRDELYISHEDLAGAERIITALEIDMKKVFSAMGSTDNSRLSAETLAYIRAYQGISRKDLLRLMLPLMDPKDFDTVIAGLTQSGYILPAIVNGVPGYMPMPDQGEASSTSG